MRVRWAATSKPGQQAERVDDATYLLVLLFVPRLGMVVYLQRVLFVLLLAGDLPPPVLQSLLGPLGEALGHVRPAQLEPAAVHVRAQGDQLQHAGT